MKKTTFCGKKMYCEKHILNLRDGCRMCRFEHIKYRLRLGSLKASAERGVVICRGRKMESNRDEAEKCINIATKALEAGDKEKAVKFLHKAEKLYPTDKAKGKTESHFVVAKTTI